MPPVRIGSRFCGPPESANGGYVCGLLAERLAGAEAVEVSLLAPPPLDVELATEEAEDRVTLKAGDRVLAEARPSSLAGEAPGAVSVEEAEAAGQCYEGFRRHVFPRCFVCGPEREAGDGLRIFAGPVAEGRVAAVWEPPATARVDPRLTWAALDCPGYFAVGDGRFAVLGRMTAAVASRPEPGLPHVVVAQREAEAGRKLTATTALYRRDGELLGWARQVWIVVKSSITRP